MVTRNTLVCIWFLLVGVLSIIFRVSIVFTILPLYFIIDIIFSKLAKKYTNIKRIFLRNAKVNDIIED